MISSARFMLSILMLSTLASLTLAGESTNKPPSSPPSAHANAPQVCFSVKEAGGIATSLVEALQGMKTLQAQLDLERAKRPARMGWTLGASFTCGPDFNTQTITCIPGAGITWGLRF